MRNLVVCCDGTWNTPDQEHDGVPTPTNVVRIFNAVADRDRNMNEQLRYYHPGVGTDGHWWEKAAGGMVGVGLSRNIMSAYRWLGVNYRSGDRMFLFGFSRGAYTVRSLAGMILYCGLLDLTGLDDATAFKRVEKAYKTGYRKHRDPDQWAGDWPFHERDPGDGVEIHFLGVWDTVGALGIPNNMAILNLLDDTKKYAFHDTRLNPDVKHARHAVALDEWRASFAPTLWSNAAEHADMKQVWFPGVHCDVGGGYLEKGLSDGALQWMMEEAADNGLVFRQDMADQVSPDFQDVMHNSVSGLFKHLRTVPRSIPMIDSSRADILHASVLQRQAHPPISMAPYRSTTVLAAGQEQTISIYADQPWNETGIYLEKDATYVFSAAGQWKDRDIPCGPKGASDKKFHMQEIAHLAGTLWGKVEKLFRKLSHNEQADFMGTKRVENAPWFALVGAIANGGNPTKDGTAAPPQLFKIGDSAELNVEQPGYLYCFANDAWNFYGNNHGSVKLTVRRK